jgi:DNA mismatch repair protein MutS
VVRDPSPTGPDRNGHAAAVQGAETASDGLPHEPSGQDAPDAVAWASGSASVTPFVAQYLAAKADHPDALLFFRMGDFYELFFEDAEKAAIALGITLTRRGQHHGAPIPMAGVPWHQAEGYIAKAIRSGYKVAVCDQLEDPAEARKRGYKAIVRRAVTRVITPGTLTDDGLLDARSANYLAAVVFDGADAALAHADVSTGAVAVRRLGAEGILDALAALSPAEILVVDAQMERFGVAPGPLTPRPAVKADPRAAERRIAAVYEVAASAAFADFTPAEISALGLLLDYVELTQAGGAPRLEPPRQVQALAEMAIDPATRASLEIERSQRGGREGSLLHAVDRTVTAAGARLLAERVSRPSLDRVIIAAHHDAIDWFLDHRDALDAVRALLKGAPDIARAVTRLALGRGGPRDLWSLRDGLRRGAQCAALLGSSAPAELADAGDDLHLPPQTPSADLCATLEAALAPDPPLLARDGGFIATGFDAGLDAVRALRDDSRAVIAALQATYAEKSGQPIKIKHNAVLGYHIEATTKQAEALLRDGSFIHRQTTANAMRFTTGELADLDSRIARAAEAALGREMELFKIFAAGVEALAGPLRAAAHAMAVLDVASANAAWALEMDAVRPDLDDSGVLIAEGARHPVVEAALRKTGVAFVPNDVRLDAEGMTGARLTLVTGPNMAGKSTYLRQIAVLAILAQAGLFVPARRVRLGLADRVFSRVGASDDLARGRSTFMMEMVETAAILHQAGPRALVILDEIGRGTATYDGLAIAWACAEHLHDVNRCRAVFATHYHELTALSERLSACANVSLRAKEWKGELVFLHEVAPGAADRSYGVQVARLAGLPRAAVDRARTVLSRLEAGARARGPIAQDTLPLFDSSAQAASHSASPPSAVEEALRALDLDGLTPREAADALYRLKALLRS